MYNDNMSFAQVALEDFPARLWMLDGMPPFADSTATGQSVSGRNLMPNPSFDSDTSGWVMNGAVRDTTVFRRRPASVKITAAVTGANNNFIYTQPIPVTPGKTYTFALYARRGTGSSNLRMIFESALGVVMAAPDADIYHTLTTEWARYTQTVTIPSGVNSLWLFAAINAVAVGDTIYVDDLTLSEGGPEFVHGHAALIKGASNSVLVGNANKLTFDAPIMKRDFEHQPFTIEVTFRRIEKESSTAQQQIFGTASAMDGLVIAGTVLSFSTKYTNTGEAKCEYDLQHNRAVTVMAVHTNVKNSLYVNGDRVAEVDITPEQQADTYLAAGTNLTSGTTTSTNLLALNGLAIFQHPLEDAAAVGHFDEASDTMDEYAVAAAFGGTAISVNAASAHPLVEYIYDTDFDWQLGMNAGVIISNGGLVPQVLPGLPVSGTWEAPIALPPNSTLSSIVIDWQGVGVKVETSTDGNNWYEQGRNTRVTTINDGFTTQGKVMFVRVTLDSAESVMNYMTVNIYGTAATPTLEGRPVALVNASIESDYDVTEYHEDWGVQLDNGSYTIPAPEGNATVPRTVQAWVRSRGLSDNMSSANSTYVNGGTAQPYKTDEWQLRTYVFTSGFSGDISFTGTGQIGPVIIYSYAMSAEQVAASYTAFTGTQKIVLPSDSAIVVNDFPEAVEIYEYDWAIETAG